MRVLIAVLLLCTAALGQTASAPQAGSSLSDADEVRIGNVLATQFIKLEGMQPTPQTTKIEEYLQRRKRQTS